jgi:hypothetical protein
MKAIEQQKTIYRLVVRFKGSEAITSRTRFRSKDRAFQRAEKIKDQCSSLCVVTLDVTGNGEVLTKVDQFI